ncbi:hypothetical protein GCM10022214_13700 [Actinomadura miaoliensis]|uniref:WD40 repeat domain-containing protein n=1 Tax=Actinomadura miaoliensis TaxID=430685 RepID=A0ABP7V9X9_9ACTN
MCPSLRHVSETVTANLLAPGVFDGVATTREEPLAFTSQRAPFPITGRTWHVPSGSPVGPPILSFPADRSSWAFDVLPGPGGDAPLVAWADRQCLRVRHLGTGTEITIDPKRPKPPVSVGLAVHCGTAAVVAVFGPVDAEVVVWDAFTGDQRAVFRVWLGHWAGLDRWILHLTGPLIGLTCDTEQIDEWDDGTVDVVDAYYLAVWDIERGEEITSFPSPGCRRAAAVDGPDGALLIRPEYPGVLVCRLDGRRVTALQTPDLPEQVAAATVAGRLLVAADVPNDPCLLLAWDAAHPASCHRIAFPGMVNDLAFTTDGTLLAATDEGLYTAVVRT